MIKTLKYKKIIRKSYLVVKKKIKRKKKTKICRICYGEESTNENPLLSPVSEKVQ